MGLQAIISCSCQQFVMTMFSLLVVIAVHGLLAVILPMHYLDLLSSQSPVRDHAHNCVQCNRNTIADLAPVYQPPFMTLAYVFFLSSQRTWCNMISALETPTQSHAVDSSISLNSLMKTPSAVLFLIPVAMMMSLNHVAQCDAAS